MKKQIKEGEGKALVKLFEALKLAVHRLRDTQRRLQSEAHGEALREERKGRGLAARSKVPRPKCRCLRETVVACYSQRVLRKAVCYSCVTRRKVTRRKM